MIELQDMAGAFNPNNVGMQMLWGGAFGSNYKLSNGRMVMEDDAGERWMLSFTSSKVDNQVVFTPLAKLQLTYEGAREAHTFTTAQNANFLYYGYDNKIACVSFSTGNLLNVYEMEGGNVDYIECDQVGEYQSDVGRHQRWFRYGQVRFYRSTGNEYGRFAERSDAV